MGRRDHVSLLDEVDWVYNLDLTLVDLGVDAKGDEESVLVGSHSGENGVDNDLRGGHHARFGGSLALGGLKGVEDGFILAICEHQANVQLNVGQQYEQILIVLALEITLHECLLTEDKFGLPTECLTDLGNLDGAYIIGFHDQHLRVLLEEHVE